MSMPGRPMIAPYTVLFIFLAFPAHAQAPRPCDGLKFSFWEHFKSQGAFGTKTPKADPHLVLAAFQEAVREGRSARDARRQRPRSTEATALKLSLPERELEQRDLYIDEFCALAAKSGHRRLTFVCTGDSRGASNSPGAFAPGRAVVERGCFLSTYQGDDFSLKNFQSSRWGPAIGQEHLVGNKEDRYEALADRRSRQQYYKMHLHSVITNTVFAAKDPSIYVEAEFAPDPSYPKK